MSKKIIVFDEDQIKDYLMEISDGYYDSIIEHGDGTYEYDGEIVARKVSENKFTIVF